MSYRPWEETIPDVNRQVRIGTILLHKPKKNPDVTFSVDIFRVIRVQDCGEHWRGKDNLMLTAAPIHSQYEGFAAGINNGYYLMTVHTYDIADPYGDWQIVGDTEPHEDEKHHITIPEAISMRLGLIGYSGKAVKSILRWYQP